MLQLNSKPNGNNGSPDRKQPRRLFLALLLLVIALTAVLIRDRQFWFGSDESILDADGTTETTQPANNAAPSTEKKSAPAAAPAAKKPAVVAKNTETKPTETKPTESKTTESKPAQAPAPESSAVTTKRTVLPPLDVEVIAGDNHRKVHPGSNATKVDLNNPTAKTIAPATNAAENERISTTIQTPQGSYETSYPLLAQRMNVKGSVVLQALIGADGIIQNMRVLSGPSILAAAAQQAVREWRFKPILQNGQAVESKAQITVNFSIRVADGAKTTVAESRISDSLIISR